MTTNNSNNKALREAINLIATADKSQAMITERIRIVCQRLEENSDPKIKREVTIIRSLLNRLENSETDGRILDDIAWDIKQ